MHGLRLAVLGVGLCFAMALWANGAEPLTVSQTCRFADLGIADVQNALLPRSVKNDRGIWLGGFSDLYRAPTDPPGEFWIVTDRGPNSQVVVQHENSKQESTKGGSVKDGSAKDAGTKDASAKVEKRRTFPIPEFTPLILHVKANGKALQLLDATPLVGRSGKPISGRPNLAPIDDSGYDFAGQQPVPFSANGIDPEGLVRAADGTFWLAEEYRPSLLKVDAKGKVLKRYIPHGQKLPGADYTVVSNLPAIYAKRQDNRGFEGLAISGDGRTLYIAMQSSLANPTAERSKLSRIARILAFDTHTERPIAEYAYQFDRVEEFNPDSQPDDMKISALAMIAPGQMLVLERDEKVQKIYRVELAAATNLLKLPSHSASDDAAIEAVDEPGLLKIKPLPKTLVADLSQQSELSGKLEGMAVVDARTLAVVNDNDFGFEGFDEQGRARPNGKHSNLFLLQLPADAPALTAGERNVTKQGP